MKGIRLKLMKKSHYYKRDYLIHMKMRQNNIFPAHTVCRRESLIFDIELTGHHDT